MKEVQRTGADSRPDRVGDRDAAASTTNDVALTHVNEQGEARMVDVGHKSTTKRAATASCTIRMSQHAANAIRNNQLQKGDCLAVARIAAIQAAKQTSHLIPLCHLVLIDSVEVDFVWRSSTELECRVSVRSTGPTGVEMEALTATSVGALTIYDMCKAVDRSIVIGDLMLTEKTGGVRGDYRRPVTEAHEDGCS
jgi:cyclic pyranopterin phosphate synthase